MADVVLSFAFSLCDSHKPQTQDTVNTVLFILPRENFPHFCSTSMCTITIEKRTIRTDEAPTSLDVLHGRGRPIQRHEGNRRLHDIVDSYREVYHKATRTEKTNISISIVRTIRDSGGRFLKLDSDTGTYEDVGDSIARDKVSHTFRTRSVKKMKPRRPRFIKQKTLPPTNQTTFLTLLRSQKQIFRDLVREADGDDCEIDDKLHQNTVEVLYDGDLLHPQHDTFLDDHIGEDMKEKEIVAEQCFDFDFTELLAEPLNSFQPFIENTAA